MKFKLFVSVVFLISANLAVAELVVTEARVKAPIPGQTLSAGYFSLENTGRETVSIVGVVSGSASRVEMHTHVMNDGMMSMIQVESVEVKAGEFFNFVEGGHHLMIFDPDTKALTSGEFDLVFDLSDGSQIEAIANVEHFMK